MIRPLISSMYDYRLTFAQETDPNVRNGYKIPYFQASAFAAAQEIFSKMQQENIDPEDAIKAWNAKSLAMSREQKSLMMKQDYKTRLDEIFKANNRNYYRNRESQRALSKDRIEDYRSPATRPDPNTYSFVKRQYSGTNYSQGAKYYSSNFKEGYSYERYKGNDRY